MRFLDLFAGIGGFRMGMERAGHECVGWVEWDKFARRSYEAIHDTRGEWTAHDITGVTDAEWRRFHGTVDVICGGFPCQSFSVAGNGRGFSDTRGTMFFEIARAAKQIQPQLLFLENVKGLLSHDKGETFAIMLSTLDELGYDAEWQVLNSKDFGVPQNRERVFIIGHLRGGSRREIFPIQKTHRAADIKVVGTTKNADAKGTNSRFWVHSEDGSVGAISATEYKQPKQIIQPISTPNRSHKDQNGRRVKAHGDPMFTITSQEIHGVMIREATKTGYDMAHQGDAINYSVPNSQTRRGRVGKGVANTLDTNCQQGVLTEGCKIRRLTPKECWRLQSFPDWAFEKAAAYNTDHQLYKQAGNSVTVNVIYQIAKRLV